MMRLMLAGAAWMSPLFPVLMLSSVYAPVGQTILQVCVVANPGDNCNSGVGESGGGVTRNVSVGGSSGGGAAPSALFNPIAVNDINVTKNKPVTSTGAAPLSLPSPKLKSQVKTIQAYNKESAISKAIGTSSRVATSTATSIRPLPLAKAVITQIINSIFYIGSLIFRRLGGR